MRFITSLAVVAALAAQTHAYIRFDCRGVLVEERSDPIVNPGQVAGHVHKIVGGDGFDLTMDHDQALASTCSTCPIKQDLSNYWTPKLYYRAQNGTFINVPGPGDPQDQNSGMIIYYQQRGPNTKALKAFPKNFRMLAGDPRKRSFRGDFASDAVSFACLGADQPETHEMPNYNCPHGLRVQIYFPSCWDGKNLDSADHRSHMSYPKSGNHDNGPCPDSHPVQLISLFYEVLYDTNRFKDMWYGDEHPFVLSNGDTTGYSFHGDFVNGWDVDVLQTIVDTCTDDSKFGSIEKDACPIIEQYTASEMQACKKPTRIDEPVRGLLDKLPGCNPVTSGPADVVPSSSAGCGAPVIDGSKFSSVPAPSSGAPASAPSSNSPAPPVPAPSSANSGPSKEITPSSAAPEEPAPTGGSGKTPTIGNFGSTPTGPSHGACSPTSVTETVVQQYQYVGCATDDHVRSLQGATTIYSAEAGRQMSVEYCADFCQGAPYFGLEYGDQCFCGDSVPADRMPSAGSESACRMPCKGNPSQTCGGDWVLSLYRRVPGGSRRGLAVEGGMKTRRRYERKGGLRPCRALRRSQAVYKPRCAAASRGVPSRETECG